MKKILIIEDNSMMRMFLSNYLGRHYQVEVVESPSAALELCERGSYFDLIISDYYNQGSEEIQAIQALNLQVNWRGTSLFMLTDEDKSEQRIAALSIGARDTLSKPFNPKELNLRVGSLLDQTNQFTDLRTVA